METNAGYEELFKKYYESKDENAIRILLMNERLF